MERICGCGKEFKTRPSRLKNNKGKFCSKKCMYKYRIPGGFKKGHPYVGLPKKVIKKILCLCGCDTLISERGNNGVKNKYIKGHQGRGRLHYKWQGGITPVIARIRSCKKYLDWRRNIFKKDGFRCVECLDNRGGNLNADHYPVSFAEIIYKYKITRYEQSLECDKLWDTSNGRTLCINCHKKTENYARQYKES